MAKRTFTLTEAAVKALEQAEQATKQVTELRRMQGVRLYGTGAAMTIITQVTQASEPTLRRWVGRYKQEGVNGLRNRRQGGNNRKLTRDQRAELKRKLQQYRPVDVHISQGEYWTASDLKVAVERWFGVTYRDKSRYPVLLRESGFSFQRTAKIYRSQPSAAVVGQFEAELEKK